ncbi:nucleic acid binding protein [Gracilibacillus halophilus YIM-C55.5]|uniref:Nucleic acid binding protein n=1 Tax=Gracilibacillus halophilus YIM-C55.5 TaxID=1308866 RepID=N4WD25_9BACI|nr:hypothetical protein [Gracilibacillus halophilus]ENH97139.1 nucleic acid binding protein [Gracilibacillus halophilus YIM-C55.5]
MIGVLIATLLAMILYVVGVIITVSLSSASTSKVMKYGLTLFVVGYILTAVIFYFVLPAVTIPNMLFANLVIAVVFMSLLLFTIQAGEKIETKVKRPIVILFSAVIISVIVVVVAGFMSLEKAHQSITTSEEDEAEPLTKEETPITVAPEFARNKIQKSMSAVPNPQFYDLGKLQVQRVDEEVVYVAPVEFTGFFKYIRGKETAGYFTISATNVNAQPEFHDHEMKYTNSSYFSNYVKRVIYNQYPHYIQSGEAQLEVDDNGKAWYVQTLYRPMHITNNPNMDELRVVVIDPTSSEMEMFRPSDAPSFVEGSISSEMATVENNYFGKYIHGWLNSVFGKRDVKIPNASGSEKGVTPIFASNGEMFYFTDMTSPKENIDSALGYTLIHARTGELTYFGGEKNTAIMDSEGAKQIVNKQFPEKQWEGYMPVLYNIDGNPTWVVNVLDPNGLHKQYAYIKANDSDFAVFGDTANETLDAYRMALLQNPGNVGATDEANLTPVSGTVDRVLVTSTEEGQMVQFLLENDQTIYTVNASTVPRAIFLSSGDMIEAQVQEMDGNTATVEEMTIDQLTE